MQSGSEPVDQLEPGVGHRDETGSAIVRVGDALHQPVGLGAVDDPRDVAGTEHQLSADLDGPQPTFGGQLEPHEQVDSRRIVGERSDCALLDRCAQGDLRGQERTGWSQQVGIEIGDGRHVFRIDGLTTVAQGNINSWVNNYSSNLLDADEHIDGDPRRWAVLWIMCGSLVLVVVSVSSLNVAIPAVQQALDASGSELAWIIDSYALVFAGLLLPAGAAGDRYGRRGALLVGLAVFAAASVGGMMATSAVELIVWRGVMGAGAALIMPATLSIVTTVFPPAERQRAVAIWAGFAGAGGVIGLLSSGLLLHTFWWGSVFAANLPIVVMLAVAVIVVVPTSRDALGTALDPIGAALSVVALGSFVFAIIEGPELGWTSATTAGALAVATVSAVAFVVWEMRSDHPMLDPRYFTDRHFSLGSLAITATFFGIFGMFFVMTQYLQFVQGHDALGAAIRILPYGIVLLVVAPQAARLVERFGAKPVMTVGMIIAASGLAVLGMLAVDSGFAVVALGLILVAIGTGLLMPPATSGIVGSLPPDKAGVGSAMNDATRELGGTLGIAAVGALMAIGYRNELGDVGAGLDTETAELAEDSLGGLLTVSHQLDVAVAEPLVEAGRSAFTAGMQIGMFVAAGLLTIGAAVVAAMHPTSPQPEPSTRPQLDPAGVNS